MASPLARYPLAPDGAIRHWLRCGPLTAPLHGIDALVRPDGSPFGDGGRWILTYWAFDPASLALKRALYQQLTPPAPPTERPALHAVGFDGRQWDYAKTGEDNVVDFSRFNFSPTRMQGWVFACLESDRAETVAAELSTIGPARIWLNGAPIHATDAFSYVAPLRVPIALPLRTGPNDLWIQGEMLGWREARLALGLRFPARPDLTVALPLGDVSAEQWHRAEAGLNALVLKQFAFPRLPGAIALAEDADAPFTFDAAVRAPSLGGDADAPAAHARLDLAPGDSGALPITPEILAQTAATPGEHTLTLILRPADGTPLAVQRPIWASLGRYSAAPYATYDARRAEARDHLAGMSGDVLAAMAAVETGRAARIDPDAIAHACAYLDHRYDCADFYAVELLALLAWYGEHPALHAADRRRIEDAFLGFKYWLDEPGLDAMCYFTENHQILFHVTAYLAGQRWPDRTFRNSGRTGRDQRQRARPRIESWILRRLRGGFSEWDSNAYLALDIFAMLALVEFAASPRLREMATALLHKAFFMIACQSFRGTHGSTHGRCYVEGLKSARFENTSSLQRIAWGMGHLNGETRATGLLALARHYRVPEVLERIGADLPGVLVTRARSRACYRPQFDLQRGAWDVRTITYRSPDAMLSAAVDYRPGAMGIQEHLWQATLGPEAVVFTTYPGNSQQHGNARPNYWAGSVRLPRVGMSGRTAIGLYRLEPGVGLGFTHAYFPAAMFDEVALAGPWAFARQGDGYVALWSDGALAQVRSGPHAYQELRSRGAGAVWIAHVGRAAEDGNFATFCRNVAAHPPQAEGTSAQWTTPQGDALAFSWEGPLTVNGRPENWDDFPHYANAYTETPLDADHMAIRHGDRVLTLDLAHGGVLDPTD